jgi:hypothetical protein
MISESIRIIAKFFAERGPRGAPNTLLILKIGAGEESRTLDLQLGKLSLYQLSYTRKIDPISNSIT